MRRVIMLCLLAALALVIVVPMAGCQKVAEKAAQSAVEKATGVKVDEDGGKVTVTGKDGTTAEVSSEEGTYPDGFPSDFPQYGNAKVDGALKTAQDGKEAFTVTLKSPDAAADVFDWYVKELEGAGWTIESQMNGTSQEDAYATLAAVNGALRGSVTMTRGADESETGIMIGINPNE